MYIMFTMIWPAEMVTKRAILFHTALTTPLLRSLKRFADLQ